MLPSSLLFVLHILISVTLTVRLLYRKLAVSTTLAWIIILFSLPYIGIFKKCTQVFGNLCRAKFCTNKFKNSF